MRMLLLFLGIAGSAVLASGQTATAPAQMTANSIQRTSPETWQLRGAVRIVQGMAIITADEADAQTGPNGTTDFALRGNVHLTTSLSK